MLEEKGSKKGGPRNGEIYLLGRIPFHSSMKMSGFLHPGLCRPVPSISWAEQCWQNSALIHARGSQGRRPSWGSITPRQSCRWLRVRHNVRGGPRDEQPAHATPPWHPSRLGTEPHHQGAGRHAWTPLLPGGVSRLGLPSCPRQGAEFLRDGAVDSGPSTEPARSAQLGTRLRIPGVVRKQDRRPKRGDRGEPARAFEGVYASGDGQPVGASEE